MGRAGSLAAFCHFATAAAAAGAREDPIYAGELVPDWSRQTGLKLQNFSLDREDGFQLFQLLSRTADVTRRKLRERTGVRKKMEIVQQDDEALVKLENAGIERSKAVDSAVLGKYKHEEVKIPA